MKEDSKVGVQTPVSSYNSHCEPELFLLQCARGYHSPEYSLNVLWNTYEVKKGFFVLPIVLPSYFCPKENIFYLDIALTFMQKTV